MGNADIIRKFYEAFARLDGDTMQACYGDDAQFDDPAFSLRGRREVGGMWRMLCQAVQEKGRDVWKLEFRDVRADERRGSAHWEPYYRFSKTGRMVHNIIDAEFEFRDGLILSHRDSFDFWRWSRQALGPAGLLLGWTPLLKAEVRKTARAGLDAYLSGGNR